MWSLSLPQVAATLAAALVGFQVGLLTESVFNGVIVLMLVTSILGPVLTARFASQLPIPTTGLETVSSDIWWESQAELSDDPQALFEEKKQPLTIVVPISNPLTERYLIEMAALLARHEAGRIVPLSIMKAHVNMDEPQLTIALRQSQRSLRRALEIAREFKVEAVPETRIDDDVAEGISRTAREQNASLIVMGWSETMGLRARLFGNVIDRVFWSSHCPVAVMRLLDEPVKLRRILVPVKNLTPQALRPVQFAQLFAATNHGEITLLHICDRRTAPEQNEEFESALRQVLSPANISIKIASHDDIAQVILQAAPAFDLVVLRSMRRRTVAGLAVSDVTTEVIKELTCSLVMFGEPQGLSDRDDVLV